MTRTYSILVGDCRARLAELPAAHFHTCITSPPYWGLRDYGCDGQLGLESTPESYIAGMVEVFRAVRRVLRDDGTLWLNIGDCYAGSGRGGYPGESSTLNGPTEGQDKSRLARIKQAMGSQLAAGLHEQARQNGAIGRAWVPAPDGLKQKDLVGIPWMLAFALRADGWYLRSDIIWAKPNPMPESVTDRPTKSHEYLFLLSKSERYFYDAEAIKEPDKGTDHARGVVIPPNTSNGHLPDHNGLRTVEGRNGSGANKKTVWRIPTQGYSEAHFATFPEALVRPCVMAGTSAAGCCAACGRAVERAVERAGMVLDRSDRTHEKGRTRTSGTMVEPPKSRTVGWEPACDCNAGFVPCRVLDPFGGAGTTAVVATQLGRHATLIELNPEYADMARRRIDKGLRPHTHRDHAAVEAGGLFT